MDVSEDHQWLNRPVVGEERGGAGARWCPGVARFPGSPPGGGRVSDDRRHGWRGVVVAAAAGAADAGGGGPLGEDFGVGAEFVADGGVEIRDEVAGMEEVFQAAAKSRSLVARTVGFGRVSPFSKRWSISSRTMEQSSE